MPIAAAGAAPFTQKRPVRVKDLHFSCARIEHEHIAARIARDAADAADAGRRERAELADKRSVLIEDLDFLRARLHTHINAAVRRSRDAARRLAQRPDEVRVVFPIVLRGRKNADAGHEHENPKEGRDEFRFHNWWQGEWDGFGRSWKWGTGIWGRCFLPGKFPREVPASLILMAWIPGGSFRWRRLRA